MSGSHPEPMTRFLFSVWRLQASWCGAPSLARGWVCNLLIQLLLGLARVVTLGSKSRRTRTHDPFETPPTWRARSPIYIPQEQGGPVITLGTGFPFVTSYDSQGYSGGILTHLHTDSHYRSSLYSLGLHHIESTISISSAIVLWFLAVETCLPCHSNGTSSYSTIPAFKHYVTVFCLGCGHFACQMSQYTVMKTV
jgi:hypothetical protein